MNIDFEIKFEDFLYEFVYEFVIFIFNTPLSYV